MHATLFLAVCLLGSEDKDEFEVFKAIDAHNGSARALVFSPCGKYIATGGDDEVIRIWNVESGKEHARLEGHTGGIFSLCYYDEGKKLFSGSEDKTIKLWDTGTKRELQTVQDTSNVKCLALDAKGQLLLSGSSGGTIKVWDAKTLVEKRILKGHTVTVFCLSVSKENNVVASGAADTDVRVWDIESGECLFTSQADLFMVYAVAFEKQGKRFISGGLDGRICVWDYGKATLEKRIQAHHDEIRGIAVLKDGLIVSGSLDETLKLTRLDGEKVTVTSQTMDMKILGLQAFEDLLAVFGSNGKVVILKRK